MKPHYISGGLNVVVGHLNASVGRKLTVDQLASALRAGTVRHIPELTSAALILSMFAELSPELILHCATEAGADVRQANQLYRESQADLLPPVPAWEAAVRELL